MMAQDKPPRLNIEQARDLLSPYLDGEVTATERALIEQALADSADLRRELATLRRTVAVVSALPPAAAPRPFTLTAAHTRPRSTAPKRSVWGLPAWAMGWAGLAAALLGVLVAGGLFWSMRFGAMQPAAPAVELAKAPVATAPPVQVQSAAEPAESAAEKPAPAARPTEIPAPSLAAPNESAAQKAGPAALPTEMAAPAQPVTQEAAMAPTEAPLPEMTAPAAESDKLEAPAEAPAEQLAGAAAAPTPSPLPVEAEALTATDAQESSPTEEYAADASAAPPTVPSMMGLTAPVQEEAANAAGAEMRQAAESAPASPAAAEPLESSQAAPTPPQPTASPTMRPSPTPVAMLTLQPPPSPIPTATPAPASARAMSGESLWLVVAMVVLLLIGGVVWLVSKNRQKGRL